MTTPCRPSAPPVMSSNLFASSYSTSAMPIVTISRVRSVPRTIIGLVARPSTAPIAVPTASPTSGSGITCLANSAAPYAPTPKYAVWPSETMPA